jgi:tryptophanyl-tRNA synthetase
LPGTDGTKMSKSYGNAILMRDEPAEVTRKVRGMITDPARVRRTDPGNPEKCPVWDFHKVYSNDATRDWVVKGCTTAGIGCLDCKQPVIDAINAELKPIRERAEELEEDPTLVRNIIQDGCEKASDIANDTMRDVRDAMGLNYS